MRDYEACCSHARISFGLLQPARNNWCSLFSKDFTAHDESPSLYIKAENTILTLLFTRSFRIIKF